MNRKEITIALLTASAPYLLNLIKVGLSILVYYKFGLVWSIGVALFFLFNILSAIEKGIYDLDENQKEMKSEWSRIYSSRRTI